MNCRGNNSGRLCNTKKYEANTKEMTIHTKDMIMNTKEIIRKCKGNATYLIKDILMTF